MGIGLPYRLTNSCSFSSSSLQIISISDIKLEEQSPVSRALYLQTESTSHQSQNINIDIKLKRESAPITRHKETFQCNWRTSKGQKRERERKSLCKDIPQKNTNSNDTEREETVSIKNSTAIPRFPTLFLLLLSIPLPLLYRDYKTIRIFPLLLSISLIFPH